jgi:type II secretory ATPase GspE/PulE/Tfp pilus assembly ATPase PilB-like protein
MVGEIRDSETAELAIHAGLTGHYVLSTLHTNDALGAVPRLLDMGVEAFLLASTLDLVVAQRLVRRLCPDCLVPLKGSEPIVESIRAELDGLPPELKRLTSEQAAFSRPTGCSRCAGTGYRGRLAIAEAFALTDEMQKILVAGNDADAVARELKRQKFVSLRQDGILKAAQGLTSIEEVIRVTTS